MDETQKPKTLTLVRVGSKPRPPKWKKEFELMVEAIAEGAPRFGIRADPRVATIINWMQHGDLRPLAVEIAEGAVLDRAVGRELMRLIDNGQVSVKQAGRGARKQPNLLARDALMFLAYKEQRKSLGSEATLSKVANDFGIGIDTVRRAVREMRKRVGKDATKDDLIS